MNEIDVDDNHGNAAGASITATTGTNWFDPTQDGAGNMTSVPKPSSLANGLTLTWDAWNRLVEVKDGGTTVGKYEFDGLNRRVKKHIDSQSPGSPNGIDKFEHLYYNSAWQILETRDTTAENDQPESLQPDYQYVWSARYIDAAVERAQNTDTDGLCDDQRIYFLSDANYNVVALLTTLGAPLERYLYDPYGKVTIYTGDWSSTRSVSLYNNTLLYTGREYDPETGLYHYRNRPYDAELGRFPSRDPIGYTHGLNLYTYVNARPTRATDAMGMYASDAPSTCVPVGPIMPASKWRIVGLSVTAVAGGNENPFQVTEFSCLKERTTKQLMKCYPRCPKRGQHWKYDIQWSHKKYTPGKMPLFAVRKITWGGWKKPFTFTTTYEWYPEVLESGRTSRQIAEDICLGQ